MAELNVTNLNKKSGKYLFKKKLTLSKKSKNRLLIESFFMFILSCLLLYLNYLIPNNYLIFRNFYGNVNKIFKLLLELSLSDQFQSRL